MTDPRPVSTLVPGGHKQLIGGSANGWDEHSEWATRSTTQDNRALADAAGWDILEWISVPATAP